MATSEPIDILLGHNRWANRRVLEQCRRVTPEQFHQNFDIGPGTLHDTMTHVIGAMLRWADRIDQRTLRESIEGRAPGSGAPMTRRSIDELLALNEQACADFAAVVARQRPRFAEVREWVFGAAGEQKSYRFNVVGAVIHVTNHGMHHRAQCMNMLKRAGAPVNADLDELEWQLAGEP